jgi:hypothetical protein
MVASEPQGLSHQTSARHSRIVASLATDNLLYAASIDVMVGARRRRCASRRFRSRSNGVKGRSLRCSLASPAW